ncbi:MAG: outer membrane beta-barrel protein [Bacteroidota bacterium]
MKTKFTFSFLAALLSGPILAQNDSLPADTNRIDLGKVEIIIIDHREIVKVDSSMVLKEGEEPKDGHKKKSMKDWMTRPQAHWAGLEMGFGINMNSDFGTDFQNNQYWENDPAESMQWNWNILEHKFKIYKNYVGITTGLGFNFNQMAFKDNYVLQVNADTLFAVVDTAQTYTKNKLRSNYLTIPLLLELGGKKGNGFYFATGVIGGIRLSSKIKRQGEIDGKNFREDERGVYGLNPFKLDATVRLGYSWFGLYANYSLVPVFDKDKTVAVHPLTFGLTANF